MNGSSVRSLFINHLKESKCFENSLLKDQSSILTIDDYCFGLRSYNGDNKNAFILLSNFNFPINNSIEETIESYNDKISDTLFLTFFKKKQIIIPYFFTCDNLFIKYKEQFKNVNIERKIFNFEFSDGITCCCIKEGTSIRIKIAEDEKKEKNIYYLIKSKN